jgi:hypothetical protein
MSPAEWLLLAAALTTAVGVLVAAALHIYRIMHRIDQALGVDERGRTVSQRLAAIEHQVWPNSGESMFDRVRQLEGSQLELRAEVRVVRDLLSDSGRA